MIAVAGVTTVAVAIGVGTAIAAGVGPDKTSTFCAEMPDAVGLYTGNPVTQMGFEVGRVGDIAPRGGHVEVTFTVDSGRSYPMDVRAVTRSKSLLADRSLELVGNYQGGPRLNAGQCIPLDHSHTPKSISEIAGSAADFIDAIAPANGQNSVESAVAGLDEALRGQGDNAAQMFMHAAAATEDPDKLVADIGSSIMNMAPLTDKALAKWGEIRSLVEQMPEVVAAGVDLWPGVIEVCEGIGWLVATLDDIQRNYGDDIWPFVNGTLVDVIHLAATRSKDMAGLLSSIPSVAGLMRQQSSGGEGLSIEFEPPTVALDTADAAQLCELLNSVRPGSCDPAGGRTSMPTVGLLDLVLLEGN
jgi:virulence factor Mce-like protein